MNHVANCILVQASNKSLAIVFIVLYEIFLIKTFISLLH